MPETDTLPADLLEALRDALSGDRVLTGAAELEACATDATELPGEAGAVVLPETTEEVRDLVKLCREHGTPLIARGAGTGLSGGAVARDSAVIADLSGMDEIVVCQPGEQLAVVQPGVVVEELNEHVREDGLRYGPEPASSDECTIGGNVAENAGGMRAAYFGVTRDQVLALTAVTGAGEVIETGAHSRKNVAGYDLTSLLIGSEGTLALVTEIAVELTQLPVAKQSALARFPDEARALEAAQRITATYPSPYTLEFMDRDCVELSRKEHRAKLLEDGEHALLILETVGDSDYTADARLEQLRNYCLDCELDEWHDIEDYGALNDLWKARRTMSEVLFREYPGRVNEDICVPRQQLGDFVLSSYEIAEEEEAKLCNYGHAADGNIHLTAVPGESGEEGVKRTVRRCMELAVGMDGTISGEHGIGLTKREFMELMFSDAELELMRSLKRCFDPDGILNPGKVFPDSDAGG